MRMEAPADRRTGEVRSVLEAAGGKKLNAVGPHVPPDASYFLFNPTQSIDAFRQIDDERGAEEIGQSIHVQARRSDRKEPDMSGIVFVTFRSHDVNGRWIRIRALKQ